MSQGSQDARLGALLECIVRLARGELDARVDLSERLDEIDGIGAGLNMLAEELGAEQAGRRRAERQLGDEVEAYENAPAFFCSIDASDLRVVRCNTTLATALGRPKAELVGRSVLELHAAESRATAEVALADIAAGRPPRATELELQRADGRVVAVTLGGSAMVNRNGERRLRLVWRDVSEQRRLEEELRQAQKMEAIGRLAGGIAHDFNNLLSVILAANALAAEALPPTEPALEDLNEVRKAAERAANLTRQLLAFSRKQVLQPRVLEVNAILSDIMPMIKRTIGEDIELELSLAPHLGCIRADAGAVGQAVLNLVVNARDAMPDGGKLLIETVDATVGDDAAARGGGQGGPHVVIGVTDSGTGMDEATRARIFEPFFTTKPVGQGTGLGLAMVFGIVKQSEGHVEVESAPGRGTTFKLYFPCLANATAEAPAAQSAASAAGGRETILVVEDELELRKIVQRLLESRGYAVIVAESPLDALAIAQRDPRPLDLLLTDVVMPQMSGKQLSDRMTALRPGLRTLYMSGYTDDAISHHGLLDEGVELLPKPITAESLLTKVRRVLDAARPGAAPG
jgi:two-component system cell cycle sensor histidine kinase/response regulator CckA